MQKETHAVLWRRLDLPGGRFVARVGVDDGGLVTDYGEIWAREEVTNEA